MSSIPAYQVSSEIESISHPRSRTPNLYSKPNPRSTQTGLLLLLLLALTFRRLRPLRRIMHLTLIPQPRCRLFGRQIPLSHPTQFHRTISSRFLLLRLYPRPAQSMYEYDVPAPPPTSQTPPKTSSHYYSSTTVDKSGCGIDWGMIRLLRV